MTDNVSLIELPSYRIAVMELTLDPHEYVCHIHIVKAS